MRAYSESKEPGPHSEELKRMLALGRMGEDEHQREQPKRKPRQRYEAILTHYRDGVLARELFEDSDNAKRWLFRRWAALCVPLSTVDSLCAAAIYDRNNYSLKRIFSMGALHLLDD